MGGGVKEKKMGKTNIVIKENTIIKHRRCGSVQHTPS
jgi:hypothetical protein